MTLQCPLGQPRVGERHSGVRGNEEADELGHKGTVMYLVKSDPAVGLTLQSVRKKVND